MAVAAPVAERVLRFIPHGAIRDLGWLTDPEIVIEGPANTGKTFGICHLLHRICLEHPGVRILMIRKTLVSLTDTALVTLREKVLIDGDPCDWFGGSRFEPASLRYDNGSRIVVGGMDNPSKFLSGEYDIIYANELWELTVEDYETLLTRLRNGVLAYPRFIGDTNPTYTRHWMYQRPAIKWLKSTHADNPTVTDKYLENLKQLTGNRYQRFYLGERVGLENAVYPQLDPRIHIQHCPTNIVWEDGAIGVDYGTVHPSAIVVVMRDSWGRYWVRTCWAEEGGETEPLESEVGRLRRKYNIWKVRTDPTMGYMANRLGGDVAKSNNNARFGRIQMVTSLLEQHGSFPRPYEMRGTFQDVTPGMQPPETCGLLFDADGEGIQDLFDEAVMYRYEPRETDFVKELVPVRKDEDRVAAMEYAIEKLCEVQDVDPQQNHVGPARWRRARTVR